MIYLRGADGEKKWGKKDNDTQESERKLFHIPPKNALGLGVESLAEFARVLPPLFRCHLWLKNPTKPV